MHKHTAALLLMLACTLSAHAQLVPKDAAAEKVADGYKFTEGPALGPDGNIYFTDIPAELILKFDPESGETTEFRTKTGRANGLMWFEGDLYTCCHGARALRRYPIHTVWYEQNDSPLLGAKERLKYQPTKPDTIASEWTPDAGLPEINRSYRLNSPNDLVIDSHGYVYFTDPRYGNRDDMELETEGVYFTSLFPRANLESSRLKLLDDSLIRPNGIVLSPDESILYVADHGANWIYAYDIKEPGEVENKRKFAQLNDGQGRGSDGMCVDQKGRLYATGHGKVWVFEPTGQLVATIDVGKQTTNCTFGEDGKTLYITANKGLYRITLNTDAPLKHAEKKEE